MQHHTVVFVTFFASVVNELMSQVMLSDPRIDLRTRRYRLQRGIRGISDTGILTLNDVLRRRRNRMQLYKHARGVVYSKDVFFHQAGVRHLHSPCKRK